MDEIIEKFVTMPDTDLLKPLSDQERDRFYKAITELYKKYNGEVSVYGDMSKIHI